MPPWTASPILRTAVGIASAIALVVLLGAPHWLMLVALVGGIVVLCVLAFREHAREMRLRGELQFAVERLSSGAGADAGAPVRVLGDLPARLEILADELAARLDDANTVRKQLQVWLETFPDPIIVIDAADVIQMCNEPAGELLELPCNRIVGRSAEQVFTHAELLRIIAQARRSGIVRLQVRISAPTGIQVWEIAAKPARPGGDVVLALRDASEEALAMQVKTDFVANASHELRTPIAAIRTAVETLSSLDDEDPAMRKRIMGMIEDNVARLEEMARDLLDLSRLESPEAPLRMLEVRGSELASQMNALFEGVCRERGISLAFEFSPQLESIETDPDLLHLSLRNLIDNATRFAFEGTVVRVVGRPIPGAGGQRPGVRFEVIDRGPGIPLAAQQRIFERYFQIDSARTTTAHRRGSGLGLAIVKHAVRRLGGTVRVHSIWQQGTTMTIELPDAIGAGEQSPGGD